MDRIYLNEDSAEKLVLLNKKVLNFQEACLYTGISKSTMYKKTSKGLIPHSKPTNKTIFFEREKLEDWLLSNPIMPGDDIESFAINYVANKPLLKRGEWL